MLKYFIVVGIALAGVSYVNSCNEAVCASIVSKCLLTQSCKCEMKNCTCCKDCFTCLSNLWDECCSCVELCPKMNRTESALNRQSHVEDLPEPISTLFESLVSESDSLERWIAITYPIDFDVNSFKPAIKQEISSILKNSEQELDINKNVVTLNCSVAFMSECIPWNKCKASCQSMGAKSYRWFHDGCCECVGEKCINYGINESRCTKCKPEVLLPQSELTYGEDV